jgi:hypothetical protein
MNRAVPIALLLLSACVVLPSESAPECVTSSDCNTAAGEECEEGVCWGDPPGGTFSAVLSPPAYRSDLVATEVSAVTIQPDGWLDPMSTAWPVALHGRIESSCGQCRQGVPIPATITVRRPSRIPGAPAFIASTSNDPFTPTLDSFSLLLPSIVEGDAPFVVTISPSETEPIGPDGPTPAELVPPLRVTVTQNDLDYGLALTLTADAIRTVHGRVIDAGGAGMAGMRVYAKGRVDPQLPLERVSTIATTDGNGDYLLVLGSDTLDVIDVVAEPPPGQVLPRLIAHDLFASSTDDLMLQMPPITGSTQVSIPVVYTDTNGTDSPVVNATVELSWIAQDSTFEAIYTVEGQTDEGGRFEAAVLAGTANAPRTYHVRITPSPDSITASKVDVVEVAAGGDLPTERLDHGSTITGVVVDFDGAPVGGVTVSAKPSLSFLWSLDTESQSVVIDRGQPTTVSNPDGTFVLWVDPAASGIAAIYDLDIEPVDFAAVPRATVTGVDGSADQDLGVVFLPDAAHVRGIVTDPFGTALGDTQVRIYEVVTDLGACIEQNAPADCQPPAIVRGTGRSDDQGIVRLTLPR